MEEVEVRECDEFKACDSPRQRMNIAVMYV